LLALASNAPAQEAGDGTLTSPRLTLVWMDPEKLLRFGFEPMADEVTEAFGEAGVPVTWRKDAAASEDDPLEIVVTLRRSPPAEWRIPPRAMGVGFDVRDERRVVFVFFANVLRTLRIRYEKSRLPTATETMLIAQALARIVAHEVIHSVAPDAPHVDEGVMQSELTRASLRASRLRLSESSIRALKDGIESIRERSRCD
jgi:hypothetical protein